MSVFPKQIYKEIVNINLYVQLVSILFDKFTYSTR